MDPQQTSLLNVFQNAVSQLACSESHADVIISYCEQLQEMLNCGKQKEDMACDMIQGGILDTLESCLNQRIDFFVASSAAQLTGSLALFSYETNCLMATHIGIVRSLTELIDSEEMEAVESSAAAIGHMATSANGCRALQTVGSVSTLL